MKDIWDGGEINNKNRKCLHFEGGRGVKVNLEKVISTLFELIIFGVVTKATNIKYLCGLHLFYYNFNCALNVHSRLESSVS